MLTAVAAAQTVRPQDDLFLYANQQWLIETPIPDDRVTYSAAAALVDRVEERLHTLIEELVHSGPHRRGSEAQQIVDLYLSVVDRDAVERRGVEPVAADLTRLASLTTPGAIAEEAGRLSVSGEGGPFDVTLATAGRRAARTVVRVVPGGLLLPDPAYYLSPAPAELSVRRAYAAYLTRVFVAAGLPLAQAESDAGAVIAFETAVASALRATAGRPLSPRVWSLSELMRAAPGFDWRRWARPQGIDRAAGLMLDEPEFFIAFAAICARTKPDTLVAWLRARMLTSMAPYLPAALSDARFDFFGTRLTGQVAPREPWKRGVSMVSEFLGDAIGRRYVAAHFSAESRARVRDIVAAVVETARAGVPGVDGARLATIDAKVGYPDQWRSYAGLSIRPDDLLGNVRRLRAFDTEYRMARARVARQSPEWLMTAQTVNAYYSPAQHEIVLPAGMLQPPYFDPEADASTNFGAIGAVVGHEISHALDVRGLASRAGGVRAQFSDLTFAESLADIIGLQLAHRAYRRSAAGQQDAVIDGRSADQRFMLAWARIWRSHSRPDYLRSISQTSPHAPPPDRANGAVRHLDAFHEAFAVSPGDRLYLAPADRLRLW